MELAKKIIEREIAQRELANTHKAKLRYVVIEQELKQLKQVLQLVNNFVLDNVSKSFNADDFEYSEFIKGRGREYNYVSNKIHYFVNGELVKILNQ